MPVGRDKCRFKEVNYKKDIPLEQLDIQHFQYEHNNRNALSHNFVSDIKYLDKTHLLVATFNGLNLMDIEQQTFATFPLESPGHSGICNNRIHTLFIDSFNNLWVGTDKGVNKISLDPKSFQSIALNKKMPNTGGIITDMTMSSDLNGIWVCTNGSGLVYLDLHTQQARSFHINAPLEKGFLDFISSIYLDHENHLWLTTHGAGIIQVSEQSVLQSNGKVLCHRQFTEQDALEDNFVMSVEESPSGNMWFGLWDKGLSLYNRQKDTFINYAAPKDLSVNFHAFPIVSLLPTSHKGRKSVMGWYKGRWLVAT